MATLSSLVHTGRSVEPLRILLHGVEGVGKTTFASKAPGAIFVGPEDGGGDLDIARINVATWADLLAAVKALTDDDHDFRVLVLDTVDLMERLCHLSITGGKTSLEKVEGGYGKGYKMAAEEQAKLIASLDALRARRRMSIIALAHTEVRKFDDPTDAAYDRYQIRMHKEAAGLWSAWADCVLFANYDIKVRVASGGNGPEILKKGKAVDKAPDRILYTERRPAFDAKNRYNLPFEIPLSWADFATEIKWDERDERCRNKPVPVPSVEDVKRAIVSALRELDWVNEEVTALLKGHGAHGDSPKAPDVPETARAAVILALRASHSRNSHTEAK